MAAAASAASAAAADLALKATSQGKPMSLASKSEARDAKKRRNHRQATVRFESTKPARAAGATQSPAKPGGAKSGVTRPGGAKSGSSKSSSAQSGAGGSLGVRHKARTRDMEVDLSVRGDTHRVHDSASAAVVERLPSEGPLDDALRIDAFDEEAKGAWVAEQQALTHAMLASYGKAGKTFRGGGPKGRRPRSSRGGYVPKARKTQRAKQRRQLDPQRQRDLMSAPVA